MQVPVPEPSAGRPTTGRQPVRLEPTRAVVAPFTLALSRKPQGWPTNKPARKPYSRRQHGYLPDIQLPQAILAGPLGQIQLLHLQPCTMLALTSAETGLV